MPATAPSVLWGRDHTEPGTVEVVGDAALAAAITRGRHPKPYWSFQPNEDAVAVAAGPSATLLAVADGHTGKVSAEVALGLVVDRLGDDPPADLPDADLLALFADANDAVLAATRTRTDVDYDSRTTLALGLVAGRRLRWAGLGDSPVVVASSARGVVHGHLVHHFVGYPMRGRDLQGRVWRGVTELADDDWVVVATDGLANFLMAPSLADAASQIVRGATDARTVAEAACRHACDAGAGDNVAVAVLAPPAAAA